VGNFFGTYSRTLDDKSRLQIPTKLVDSIPSRFYVLRGFEGCLSVYPEEAFKDLLASLKNLSFFSEANRAYIRLAASSASEMPVDSHGRIALTKQLVDDYRIGRNVTIIGVLDHFEIWDAVAYAKYLVARSPEYESLAERSSRENG
jgi:MraZ protein